MPEGAPSPRPSTKTWIHRHLRDGERILESQPLRGGITSEVSKLRVGTAEASRYLVLRSFVDASVLPHATAWLRRETEAFEVMADTPVPAPSLIALDATADHCEYPSILMTHISGRTVLSDAGIESRLPLMARQLVSIHDVQAPVRPYRYRALSTADSAVRGDGDVWPEATDLIRGPTPSYEGCTLHRDFQPGNILFRAGIINGVVDWAGFCWGPADLDVAHCATNLALLHGPEWGLRFTEAYEYAGGRLAGKDRDRRYWQVRSALACSEEIQEWATPWRDAGRTDLTERVVEQRLEQYLTLLVRGSPRRAGADSVGTGRDIG